MHTARWIWCWAGLASLVSGLAAASAEAASPPPAEPPAAAAEDPRQVALEAAVAAHARGEVAAAQRALLALSRQGVPAADYNLGVIALDTGRTAEAVRWMRRAAEAGFVTAMVGLGRLHDTGRLGRPDPMQAQRWFLKAAEAGSVDAQVEVATAHYLGRGAKRDRATAARWYREAAKGGDVGAQYLIASMYEAGDGVEQDLRLARYWYDIAAQNGDEAAPGKRQELDERARLTPS
jgi:TPR repeat protein